MLEDFWPHTTLDHGNSMMPLHLLSICLRIHSSGVIFHEQVALFLAYVHCTNGPVPSGESHILFPQKFNDLCVGTHFEFIHSALEWTSVLFLSLLLL